MSPLASRIAASRRLFPWRAAAAAVLLALLVLWVQYRCLAYRNEFGGDADEPAHYVTGLLVHDYCAAGFPPKPLRFAENFYLHYPKVALGHWPPAFYIAQGIWTLTFGTSRTSVMLLIGALALALAFQVWRTVTAAHGAAAGLIAAATLLLLPVVQYASSRVMAEMLEAALCFAALACFVRYLQNENWRDSAGFVAFACLAILTKGAALLLAPVPLVSVVLLRRFRLLLRPSFWAPGAIIGIICLPAYTLLPNTGFAALRKAEGIRFDTRNIETLPVEIEGETGPAVTALIGIGAATWLWSLCRGKPSEDLTVAGAAVVGFLILRCCVIAAKEHRHFALIAAPLMLFFASGAGAIVRWLRRRMVSNPAWPMLLAAGVFLATSYTRQPKPHWGADRLTSDLLADPLSFGSVFVIASDAIGEGVFIAEAAHQERRLSHYVLRASQAFASANWSGWNYRLKRSTPGEMAEFLDSVPVSAVVLLSRPESDLKPHVRLLQQFLRSRPDVWRECLYSNADPASGAQSVVYRRVIPVDTSHPRIELDLDAKLGKRLSNY
jgi:Dolichyl-phosphate-mannose-protein mannosyltransferase